MNIFKIKFGSSKIFYFVVIIILIILINMVFNVYYIYNLIGPHGIGLPSQLVVRRNQAINLALLVPSKWQIINLSYGNHGDLDSKMVIESPFLSAVYIQIFKHEFPSNETQGYSNWAKQKVQSNKDYKEISLKSLSTQSYSGYLYEYTRPIYAKPVSLFWQTKNYHCIDWYFLKLNNGYDFSFCSLDTSWAQVKEVFILMINSIQID